MHICSELRMALHLQTLPITHNPYIPHVSLARPIRDELLIVKGHGRV